MLVDYGLKNHNNMRYLIIAILFASCVKSSQKENIKREPTKCTFDVSAIQRARPSFKFNVSVTGSTVRLFWKKQKNQVYTVTRNGQFVYSCTCGEYYDLNVLTGTYVYTINGYSVTVLVQGAQPSPQNNVILLDFDGHLVTGSSWNYSGDIYMAPSGLSQSQIDYIITDTRTKFAQFPVTVTTDESLYNATTRRQRLVYTTYYQWFGAVGGTSFL